MNSELQEQFLSIINCAINNHRVVQFKHNRVWRTIEPYVSGINVSTQKAGFYGFCRDVVPSVDATGSNLWQTFNVTEIEEVELTFYGFSPHPDYVGRQDQISPVYVRLSPLEEYHYSDALSVSC